MVFSVSVTALVVAAGYVVTGCTATSLCRLARYAPLPAATTPKTARAPNAALLISMGMLLAPL
jgi:hypothetical protein